MNYLALIGDIKDSRNLTNREEVQERLNKTLERINQSYREHIEAEFIITLGDEFQGLLKKGSDVIEIIDRIEREMHPVKFRFGIGIGDLNTKLMRITALGADGPVYYAARESIEMLRKKEKKSRIQNIYFEYYGKNIFEEEVINTVLELLGVIKSKWNPYTRETVWEMEYSKVSQQECAVKLNTTQPTIARRLKEGNFDTYLRTKKTLKELLRRMGDFND